MDTSSISSSLRSDQVLTGDDEVQKRSRDWWPLAYVRESRGELAPMPAAVVRPESTDQVADIVRWAAREGHSVVVRGGGSGVCGAATPPGGAVVLETTALDEIQIDVDAKIVTVGAGVFGDRLEAALNAEGLTLGHSPQSVAVSTVGGWIGTSSAGQMTPGYGFIEDHVIGLTAVLADGTVVDLKPTPRSAVGPDLRRLLIGSEGRFGVVTQVVLSCHPALRGMVWRAHQLPDFAATWALAHTIQHSGAGPTVLRGWDADDATAAFGSLGAQSGAVSVVGFDEALPGLQERAAVVERAAADLGGSRLDDVAYGEAWWQHRLGAVHTFRDVLGPERAWGELTILDTVEVSVCWPDVARTYAAMTAAISTHAAWVRCHYSHVFDAGLALYFTFVVEGEDVDGMEATYHRTWEAAMTACISSGASASHHHGMGRLKAKWTAQDVGDGAAALLERITTSCDPAGVLNPGALLP
ncbi:FAD-binding oxidoreductase [Euzebya tangerina]|uniref:FAD-binding oxidoreductase n=1 Tax=Euzebya tangerina TaxID=591198 RepID=UPI0013C30FE4|nr:FAD-binding oxidoreductase [Euzebya tangerina]